MSLQAMVWAITHPLPEEGEKLLLVILGNHAGEHGVCYPGHERLAETCPCSVRTVGRRLKTLEEMGLIARAPRFRPNGSRTSDWIVLGPTAHRGGPMQMTDPGEHEAPEAVRRLIVPPANLADGQSVQPPSATGGGTRTIQENLSLEPSARESRARQVKLRGKPVPPELLAVSLAVLDGFNATFERRLKPFREDGRPAAHLTQIMGAVKDNAHSVGLDDWLRALANVKANPPSWVEGQIDIGDVFGPNAQRRALANSGVPSSNGNGVGRAQRNAELARGWLDGGA